MLEFISNQIIEGCEGKCKCKCLFHSLNKRQRALMLFIVEQDNKGKPVVIESILEGSLKLPKVTIARSNPFRSLHADLEFFIYTGFIEIVCGEIVIL